MFPKVNERTCHYDEEMKSRGFRSMHSIEGAFSRNLTDNTIAAVNRLFGLKIPYLS
jgi:hypothetical protein